MTKKLTIKRFIKDANKKHNYKYTYENAVYIGGEKDIIITCPDHGDFVQIAHNHLTGSGCTECFKENVSITLYTFIKDANKKHNYKYTYENAVYIGGKKDIIITCPDHGDFVQIAHNHLMGNGCPHRSHVRQPSVYDTETFISRCKIVYPNDDYDYSKVIYTRTNDKVIINCLKEGHGDFPQTPNSHLQGKGCPKCGRIKSINHKNTLKRNNKKKA